MSDWNEIKRPFREALIAAFNWDRLALVLIYHCDRRLDHITAKTVGFERNVDDVIEDALRNGWLEDLAKGALEENPDYTGLKVLVSQILLGVKAEGKAYYQHTTITPVRDLIPGESGHSEQTRQLKKVLDSAIRSEVRVGEETILLVLVRDQGSRGLYAILELEPDYGIGDEDVRHSRPFRLYFPVDESGELLPAKVEVVITSPGFDPPTQSRNIEVSPFVDSDDELDPEKFILTPLRTGTLRVIVEVYQRPGAKRTRIGSKPITTVALESMSKYADWKVQSIIFRETSVDSLTFTDVTVEGNQVNVGAMSGGYVGDNVSGAVAQGKGATAVGERGVSAAGSVGGSVVTGDENVSGDQVGGDKISVGNISGGQGIAIGRGASANVSISGIPTADDAQKEELNRLVAQLDALLNEAPASQQTAVTRVAKTTQRLIDDASSESPDPDMVELMGNMLKQAAQSFKDNLPQIVDVVGKIVVAATTIANAAA